MIELPSENSEPPAETKNPFGMLSPLSPDLELSNFGMHDTPSPSLEGKSDFGMHSTPSPSLERKHAFGMSDTPSPSPERMHAFGMSDTPSPSPEPEQSDFRM
jgi:hypothetical protein